MKKLSSKLRNYYISRERRKRHKQLRLSNIRKHHKRLLNLDRKKNFSYYKTKDLREHLRKLLYKKVRFKGSPIVIDILGDFGIEEREGISYFLDKAASFIDFTSAELIFDLSNCTRVWPSAITLLCSLAQWVELTSRPVRPRLSSTKSNSQEVNSYLAHSGFYDYVGRPKDTFDISYSDAEIVKIERETKRKNVEQREDQVLQLLTRFSVLSDEELELFNCVILTEIFNNITEHGISHGDNGWWLLAQYHRRHKMISLCVADNGIGIRNSLMTGPQREDISKKIKDIPKNDGEFINLALKENVSGSISAPVKSAGFFFPKYESGARRGNGLKRIAKACKNLKIPLSILSHYGYLFLNDNGELTGCGSKEKRVFAGTMYHLVIKSKEEK